MTKKHVLFIVRIPDNIPVPVKIGIEYAIKGKYNIIQIDLFAELK